jgi:hypothetical protein
VIYHEKRPKKLKTRETKYVEINNTVYMELYSGAKMVNEKDLKTKYLRSKNSEFTVPVFSTNRTLLQCTVNHTNIHIAIH